MRNRAGWLALLVLVIAAALMIFFVLPNINHDKKPLGDAINAAGNAVKNAVGDSQQAGKPAESPKADAQTEATPSVTTAPAGTINQAAKTSKPGTPSAPAQTSGDASSTAQGQIAEHTTSVTPAFDVLRVEPDGSTVIAGRAPAHSTLEVLDGAATISKSPVGPAGDFAIVLDNPLPAGDHQLVLKATTPDGKVVTSEETATVSVPGDPKSGKLLAMVTTPGKASRLISTPTDASAAAGAQTAQSGTAPVSATPSTQAAVDALSSPPKASADIAATPPAMPAANGRKPDIQVTAVELEGSKIFIAGTAKSGMTVRGLADEKPVGQSKAGSDGHFVIEGKADLSVGDHKITVEALNAGGQSLVRVEVPFNRPAGEQVAAVAAPAAASSMASVDNGAFDGLRTEVVRAFNILQSLYADAKVPSLEQMAAGRSATSIALKSLSEYRLPVGASVSARSVADNAAKDSSAAASALDALPNDVAAVGAALKDIAPMIAKAVGPALAQQIGGGEMAMTADAGAAAATDGSKTIQQAPLTQSASNSVIIRRGDTLWQISRRVYGQGVRYTTIYLANEDQIRNPDIIQPGQIFGVPEQYRPDSEELHRERVLHHKD